MIRGLYSAASALLANVRRLEVVTNNLANAETVGFKQDRTGAAAFSDLLVFELDNRRWAPEVGQLTLSTVAQPPELDLTQGALRATGRALDVALEGPGFLAVQTPQGERYTRDGSLTRNADGLLTTSTGELVLGAGGPIRLPDGPIELAEDGTFLLDGEPVARLRLVELPADAGFNRDGRNLLAPRDGAAPRPATLTTVRQGYVEASNVDLTGAMTAALALQRSYVANQRLLQQQDEVLARAVSDIARPT